MMRILWVKAGKLLPVDTGGKIRSYNLLRELARRNPLTLLTYYAGQNDDEYERELTAQFPGALAINTGGSTSVVAEAAGYLRNLLSSAPFAVAKFTSRPVKRQLERMLSGGEFDVAVCDFLAASLNFPRVLDTPTVLFQHNVESILWQRQSQHEPNPFKRLAFKVEATKMSRYERTAVRCFNHVIAVSDHDRNLMSAMTDRERITVVPTGVDLEKYQRAAGPRARSPLVVFTGSMDWEANIDGVEFFCREVWPAVQRAIPDARFRIVGRNPHPRVSALASESVEVTGSVPSVVDHLREAAVVVVPLRIGGGTRLKIYEAMAMGKAVVSTSIGAEGLDVNHGRDILLEDSAQALARGLVNLLTDPEARREIEDAAANQASLFDWPIIAKRFEEVLWQVAAQTDEPAFASFQVRSGD